MKTCGIDIKGNEAIFVCLEGNKDAYAQIASGTKKIKLVDSASQKEVKIFTKTILDFFNEHEFDKIGIKERATKGKFAGGSVSFKIEGLIQNAPFPVYIVHPAIIKAKVKGQESTDSWKLNTYQKDAFALAIYLFDR